MSKKLYALQIPQLVCTGTVHFKAAARQWSPTPFVAELTFLRYSRVRNIEEAAAFQFGNSVPNLNQSFQRSYSGRNVEPVGLPPGSEIAAHLKNRDGSHDN
jgi:hypothetical protein